MSFDWNRRYGARWDGQLDVLGAVRGQLIEAATVVNYRKRARRARFADSAYSSLLVQKLQDSSGGYLEWTGGGVSVGSGYKAMSSVVLLAWWRPTEQFIVYRIAAARLPAPVSLYGMTPPSLVPPGSKNREHCEVILVFPELDLAHFPSLPSDAPWPRNVLDIQSRQILADWLLDAGHEDLAHQQRQYAQLLADLLAGKVMRPNEFIGSMYAGVEVGKP